MIRTNTVLFSIKLETQDKKDNEIMYLEAKKIIYYIGINKENT